MIAPGSFAATTTATAPKVYNTGAGSPDFNTLYGLANSVTTGKFNALFAGGSSISSTNRNSAFGAAALGGTSPSENTAVGWQAGRVSNCADGCVFMGAYAGWSINDVHSGGGLTAIGKSALFNATYCKLCTSIGDRSAPMYNSSSESGDEGLTVVGGTAFYFLRSGTQMSAFGSQAGMFLASGSQCSAYGVFAMQNWISCFRDTAVGAAALYAPFGSNYASGGDNTAIGAASVNSITTGAANTCIGSLACRNVTSASNNTCVGQGACLQIPILGSSNTAVGRFAGPSADIDLSTSIGYQSISGSKSSALGANTNCLGSSSICIGYGATTVESNVLVLGSSTDAISLTMGQMGTNPTKQLPIMLNGVQEYVSLGGSSLTDVIGTAGEVEVSTPSPGVKQVGLPDDIFFVRAYASVAFNSPVFTSPSGSTVVSLSADNGVNLAARFYITTGFDTRPVWASTATSVQMTMETSAPNANFVIDSKGTGTLQLRPNAVPEFTCSSSGCSSATQLSGPKYTHTGSTPTLTDYGSGDGVCNNGAGVLATSTILGKDHILTVDVTTGNGACSTGQFIRINTGVTCPTSHICDVSCRGTGASATNCRAINLSWSGTVDTGPIVAIYALTAATASTPYSFTVMCSCY